MEANTTARSNIVKLTVGMFNAAPGATYLQQFEGIISNGHSLSSLTDALSQTSAFQNIFPTESSDTEFASSFLSALLDSHVTTANKQVAVDHMLAILNNNGGDRADAMLQILVTLNDTPASHSDFGDAAQAFANKAQVAEYFSVDLNGLATDLDTLKSVISNVTQDQDSVTTARQGAESLTQTSGKLIDGYIKGATVFLDLNNNGKLDPGETSATTDDDGDFTLTGQGNLVAFGGTDISTGLAFDGTLKAPAGSTVITPVTTVIAEIVESGKTVEEAQQAVVSALDLPVDVDLKTFDPIDEATKEGADSTMVVKALALQQANVQMANLLVQAAAVVTGATQGEVDNTDAIAATVKAIAEKITESASRAEKVDLTDTALVEDTVNKASDNALEAVTDETKKAEMSAKVQDIADETAKVLTDANRKIQEHLENTDVADAANITNALKEAAKIQTVTQGDAAQAIRDGAENGNLDDIEDNFSGDKLTEAANEVEIDDTAILGDDNANTELQTPPPPASTGGSEPPAESITYRANTENQYGKIRGTSNDDILELSESNGFTLSGNYGANFVGRGGDDTLIGDADLTDRAYYEEALPENGILGYNIQDDGSLIITDGTQDLYLVTTEQDDQGYYLSGIQDLKTDTINEGNDTFTDIDKVKINSTDDDHWLNVAISEEGKFEVWGNGVSTYASNYIAGSDLADTLTVQGDVQNNIGPYPVDQTVYMSGHGGNDSLIGNPESPDQAQYTLEPEEVNGPLNYRLNNGSIEVIDSQNTLLYTITLTRDDNTREFSGTVIDESSAIRDEGTDTLQHINTVVVNIENGGGWLRVKLSDSGSYQLQGSDIIDYRPDGNYIGGTSSDDVLNLNSQDAIDAGFDPTDSSTYIRIAGQEGDDQIIGAAGTDSAGYDLREGELVGKLLAEVQDDGSVSVMDDNGELYSVILNADGTGTVRDSRTNVFNEGTDTLVNIERVSIGSREGQHLEIERDSDGQLFLRGSNIIEYSSYPDSNSGYIEGTNNNDTLSVADGQGFDPSDSLARVYLTGNGGDDALIGGAGYDTAQYHLGKSGDMFELNGDLRAEVDSNTQTVRVFDDMGTSDAGDDQDLYNVALGTDGSGSVSDLYTTITDEGDDSLEGIEYVLISGGNDHDWQKLDIQRDTDGEYALSGTNFIQYYADSKSGSIITGTKNDDDLSLLADKGFDPTDSSTYTQLIGNGGNDSLTGGSGHDTAQYRLGYDSKSGERSELIGNLLAEVNTDTQTVRIFDDMGTSDTSDDQNLYSVQLTAEGTGSVEDIYTTIQNDGTDTLEGIERVQINGSSFQNEGQGQHINIEYDNAGNLNISGTNMISYSPTPQGDGGHIRGTNKADILVAPEGPGFAPTSNDSRIRYEGAGGDDQIIGNNSFDKAIYGLAAEESAGTLHAAIDSENPDCVVISNDNGDQYEISLAADGSGTVTDLNTIHADDGTDTLSGVEQVSVGDHSQWLAVARDDSGNYHFSGSHIVEYLSHSPTNNEIRGSVGDDTLTVDSPEAAAAGIDSTNASGWAEVKLWGKEGSDTLTGAATKDTAYYRLQTSEGIDGIIQAEVQQDGTLLVRDNSQDLYRVELDQNGGGSVLDLLTAQYDEGHDTFISGIDSVRIEHYGEQNQYLEISLDETGSYQLSGSHVISYDVNQQYGNGFIQGTVLDDTLTAAAQDAVDAGFQPENADSTVSLHGSGGNDLLSGTNAVDIAKYSNWNLEGSLGVLLPELQGDGTVIVKAGNIALYQLTVDGSGNDIVTDLYTGDNSNEGVDTLTNIDQIAITVYDDVHQELKITRDDDGYHFSGTNIVSYEPDGNGGGRIAGSVNDDTLTAAGADGFNLTESTSLALEGKEGNDTLIGGAGTTTAIYHTQANEVDTYGYRLDGNSIIIYDTVSNNDLYSMNIDQTGNGQVSDLFTDGSYNEGTDTLSNIDAVSFHAHNSGVDQAFTVELTETGLDMIMLVGGNTTTDNNIISFE